MASATPDPDRARLDEAGDAHAPALSGVAAWVGHLQRTLKTCRLYDVANPTAVKFRDDLASGLRRLLDASGALRLEIAGSGLLFEGEPLDAGHGHDDPVAAAFHRDGIRTLTFHAGIERREVETFLDLVLHVTGPTATDDDLVTLLWDADLPHIAITAVPLEGDVDGGGSDDEGGEDARVLPWPGAGPVAVGPAGGVAEDVPPATDIRSDDWAAIENFGDLDHAMRELEASSESEKARFQSEVDEEARTPMLTNLTDVLEDALATETTPEDRAEIGQFIPRVLREAMGDGQWETARRTLRLLRHANPDWPAESFFQGLTSTLDLLTTKAVAALDAQGDEDVEAFLALANEFGEASGEWLMRVLAESQQKRTRRPLARTLGELLKRNPERLVHWIGDERWYVARNAVHILGWIGGDEIAGYLRGAMRNPEPRVRREVVTALGKCTPAVARPILLEMLSATEPRLFTSIVQALSRDRDPAVAERLVALLRDDTFTARPEDERRAVYMALPGQGESVIEALQCELDRGGLFARGYDAHWQAVALCIARIGTPSARTLLDVGLRSAKAGVRKACRIALDTLEAKRD